MREVVETIGPKSDTEIAKALFEPASIAIVGASAKLGSVSSRPLELLKTHGFPGEIYPVNPRYETLHGLRCYASLTDIPGPVDLVLSLVPAAATLDVIREAGRADAKAVIVFASGFAETGDAGATLQQQLVAEARSAGVRLLGPNCQGTINPSRGVFATFTPAAQRSITGGSSVAYVGQSGAVGGSVLDMASDVGLSLDAWAATGNQADLDLVEIAQALVDGDSVTTILMYAEGISDGARFSALCQSAQRRHKRLVLLRSGRSVVGKRAAASHTGAMLGDDAALIATAQRYGVLLVDDIDQLLAVGTMLSKDRQLAGRRVGVITTSGGAGILLADHCEAVDLQVPELAVSTQQDLARLVPDFGAVVNPVDVTAQLLNTPTAFDDFAEVYRKTAADPQVDGVAVVLTMVTGERARKLAEALACAFRAQVTKPLWVSWLASPNRTAEGREILRGAGIPVFDSTGALAQTIALLAPHEDVGSPTRTAEPDEAAAQVLDGVCAGTVPPAAIAAALGIRTPATWYVESADDADRALQNRPGTRFAFKIAGDVRHKSDIGGVLLDVTATDARAAYERLAAAASQHGIEGSDRIEIQEMVPSGLELLVGATVSGDGFAPLITVGSGGIATEIYRDVCTHTAPVGEDEALRMLQSLKLWPLLDGYRGMPRRDVHAAARAVSALSRMVAARPLSPLEIEINPLVVGVTGDGAVAVDLLLQPAALPGG